MTPQERAIAIAERQGWPNRTGALLDAIAGEITEAVADATKDCGAVWEEALASQTARAERAEAEVVRLRKMTSESDVVCFDCGSAVESEWLCTGGCGVTEVVPTADYKSGDKK